MGIEKGLASCLALSVWTIAMAEPSSGQPTVSADSSTQTTLAPNGIDLHISGGDRAGANLFHRFEDFSVPEDMSVVFAVPTDVRHIFSRVTGDRVSAIDGTISMTDGNASLFLLNPNGIAFGERSQLDLNGSFVASTADAILFADGLTFGASEAPAAPLLSATMPVGLQFGANPGDIDHRSQFALPPSPEGPPFATPVGLSIASQSTLALVGGRISIEGSPPEPTAPFPIPSFAAITSAGQGRIDIGSVAGGERVSLAPIREGWQLGYEDDAVFRDISLSFALTATAGTVVLQGRQIEVTNSSQLTSISLESDRIGGLKMTASDVVTIENGSSVLSANGAATDAGPVMVQAERVRLAEFSTIDSATTGSGRGGDVTIRARSVEIDGGASGRSSITTQALASGNAGDVTIDTATLKVENGGLITSSAVPNAFPPDGSVVQSGAGGQIAIVASDAVDIIGQPLSEVPEVVQRLPNNNGGLFSETRREAQGNGGSIVVRTGRLQVIEGAEISVVAEDGSLGRAGNIAIETEGDLLAAGAGTGIVATGANSAPAGSVELVAEHLTVRDRATVSVGNSGLGDAGTLTVDAASLTLTDAGQLSAATASGDGGNIAIALDDALTLRRGGTISTSAGNVGAGGNGGNIAIDAEFVVAVPGENSDITADAFDGRGGNIAIAAEGVFGISPSSTQTELSDITASSATNVDGTISIDSPNLNPSRDVVEEPDATAPPEVAQGCQAGRIQTASSLVDVGRGGLPPALGGSRSSGAVWEDIRPLPLAQAETTSERAAFESVASVRAVDNSAAPSTRPAIVEAQGWIVNAAGELELVADAPHAIATASGFRNRNCRGLTSQS